jgi:hypothetical protein
LIASFGNGYSGNRSNQPHPRKLAATEGAPAQSVVQVNDAQRIPTGDQGYGKDAAQLQGVDAMM